MKPTHKEAIYKMLKDVNVKSNRNIIHYDIVAGMIILLSIILFFIILINISLCYDFINTNDIESRLPSTMTLFVGIIHKMKFIIMPIILILGIIVVSIYKISYNSRNLLLPIVFVFIINILTFLLVRDFLYILYNEVRGLQ